MIMSNNIKVVELFAGVGGFRIGLEMYANEKMGRGPKTGYEVVWSNQWEFSTKSKMPQLFMRISLGRKIILMKI